MSPAAAARSAFLPLNIFVNAVAGAVAAEARGYITNTKRADSGQARLQNALM